MKLVIRDRLNIEGDFKAEIHTRENPGFEKYIQIRYGQRVCGAIASYVPSDKEAIYVDQYLRISLGAKNNDWVEVEECQPEAARAISIAPQQIMLLDDNELSHITAILLNKPICQGQVFPRHYWAGGRKTIKVTTTQPAGIVLVQESTRVSVDESVEPEEKRRERSVITWADIGGLDKEIAIVRRRIEYPLRQPQQHGYFGVESPRGILLYGPPGTGKTLIAKALANEAGAHIEIISGPEILTPLFGGSEQLLREKFKEAHSKAPAIILIDEIDSLAPKRELLHSDANNKLVATLLTLMDGLQDMSGVVVVGTTNRPEEMDKSLRRPGRFEREIMIGPPDKAGRRKILELHTKKRNMPLAKDVNLEHLAEITAGFTGADLAALCREAGHCALLRYFTDADLESGHMSIDSTMKVTHDDFMAAMREVQPSAMRGTVVEVVRDITLDDVGGLSDIKEQLEENILYGIKETGVFQQVGHRPAKGILLYGPSGTGKTLLARAMAHACQTYLITLRGPEVHRKWFGESEELVRAMFAKAREVAPCILLLDEVDALVPARGSDISGARESVTTQVITEMERIGTTDQVFVIATTNQPGSIDPALRRPGRLDMEIPVNLPDTAERKEIFEKHLRKVKTDADVDLDNLAKQSDEFSGADIAESCRRAIFQALKQAKYKPEKTVVTQERLLEAMEKIRHTDRFKRKTIGFDTESVREQRKSTDSERKKQRRDS